MASVSRRSKRSLIALENDVQTIYENDRTNPKLYEAIRDLAEAIAVIKGITYDSYETEQICHNLASDLYMSIVHDGFHVWHWTKYVWLRVYNYRGRYLRETRNIEFQVEDIVDRIAVAKTIYPQVEATYNKMNIIELSEVVEGLPDRIREIFNKYVKYVEGSSRYNAVWSSVMLTIIYNDGFTIEEVRLVNLEDSYSNYIRFMVNLISKRLAVYVHRVCDDELSSKSELHELLCGYSSILDI